MEADGASSGAMMIGLVSSVISMFGCTMLSRMLKGAISYARLSQKPSRAQPAAQVVPREGMARWLATLDNVTICPPPRFLMLGSTALMQLTGP